MPILPLFFKSKMMQLPDKIKIENCIFINKLPPPSLTAPLHFPPLLTIMKLHLQPKVIKKFLQLLNNVPILKERLLG